MMHLDVSYHEGAAVVVWEPLTDHPVYSTTELQLILSGLQYARTLINDARARAQLFERVGQAARDLVDGAEKFDVGRWELAAGGMTYQIWPWRITTPDSLRKAKTYIATLQNARGGLGIHLKMAFGLERILAPAAALLPLYTLSREVTANDRVRLGQLLLAVNHYYGDLDRVRVGSEVMAVNSAVAALKG